MSTLVATASVTVLNASYMPLGRTKLARAMALVINGHAEIDQVDESRILRWSGGEFVFPKVIRMLKLIAVPFDYAPEYYSRSGVLRRDEFTCGYCGITAAEGGRMTMDHILPRSRGGRDEWMNALTACVGCNGAKGARTPEEAQMPMLFQPTVPMKVYLRGGKPHRKAKKNKN